MCLTSLDKAGLSQYMPLATAGVAKQYSSLFYKGPNLIRCAVYEDQYRND
jgi:hypothetical protein